MKKKWLADKYFKTQQDVLGRTIRVLYFDMTWTAFKMTPSRIFVAAGKCLPNSCLAMTGGYTGKTTDPLLIQHGPYRKRYVRQLFHCFVYSLTFQHAYRAVA
jgi:hypothetical protein